MPFKFPIGIYKVTDESMMPQFKPGGYVIINRWFSWLAVGDVVVLRHPAREMLIIKRISKIDGNMITVLGDSTAFSEDSRQFGPVDRSLVVGKVFRFYEPERNVEKEEERIGE